jgi:GT2 family glycosyltransferase
MMAEELCQIDFTRRVDDPLMVVFVRLFDKTGATVLAFPWRLDRTVSSTSPMMLDPALSLEIVSGEPEAQISARIRVCGSSPALLSRASEQVRKYARAFRNYLCPISAIESAGRIKRWPAVSPSVPSPSISIIIPTRDMQELLERAIKTLFENANWKNKELIVIDNGSIEPKTFQLFERIQSLNNVTIIREDQPFNFSRLINIGARAARGDVLAIMNNDVETDDHDYIAPLAALACDPKVGVVGAKLLFGDGLVQHAGITLGIRGLTGHAGMGRRSDDSGPYDILSTTRRVSAVTGACMFTRREVFERLGGFSEDYVVECNDVDYCLRAGAMDLASVYHAASVLTHKESSSRQARPLREQEVLDRKRFVQQWGRSLVTDPYYPADLTLKDESLAFLTVYDR